MTKQSFIVEQILAMDLAEVEHEISSLDGIDFHNQSISFVLHGHRIQVSEYVKLLKQYRDKLLVVHEDIRKDQQRVIELLMDAELIADDRQPNFD